MAVALPRLRLAISFAGLRMMLQDLRKKGIVPMAILVSPFEAKDLKRELIDTSPQKLADCWDTADEAVGIIEGVMVTSHPNIERGKCRLIPKGELFNPDHWIAAR